MPLHFFSAHGVRAPSSLRTQKAFQAANSKKKKKKKKKKKRVGGEQEFFYNPKMSIEQQQTTTTAPPTCSLDQYDLVGVIGKGSFGTVSRIRRKADGRIMVWKELNYGTMREKEKQLVVSEVRRVTTSPPIPYNSMMNIE